METYRLLRLLVSSVVGRLLHGHAGSVPGLLLLGRSRLVLGGLEEAEDVVEHFGLK
jgi:hypothetical protein